jgi:thioredoxin-dependent peroxiredoxin
MRAALACTLLLAAPLAAQGPAVGEMAPDFTLAVASMDGVAAAPLTLSSLRGKPVVIAFFPRARTGGCTIQMKAYRDRYAEIFGNDVHLLAISTDAAEALASWAKDESFPFRFVADTDGVAGRAFGVLAEGRSAASRVLFVIDAEGKVAKIMRPFREIDPTAYDELKAAVQAVRKK